MKRYFFAVVFYVAMIWLLSSEARATEAGGNAASSSPGISSGTNGAEPRSEKSQTFNSGGDTYNFYFQKAPGPNVVNQGVAPVGPQSGPNRVEALPGNEADKGPQGENVQKVAVADVSEKSEGRWTVGIGSVGYSSTTFMGDKDYSAHGKGTAFAARYSWNRYIGIEGGLGVIDLNPRPNHATDYVWQDGTPGQWVPSDSVRGPAPQAREKVFMPTASLVLTPFRFNVFGHDLLEISLLAGAARDFGDLDNSQAFVGTRGGEVALNVSKDFAMSLAMTQIGNDDDKYGAAFNLLWRL